MKRSWHCSPQTASSLCRIHYSGCHEVAIMAKWLVIIGIIFILVGVAWPWLSKLGIGHLPGDIYIERKGFSLYFPITTSIIISLVLSLLFWIFRK
jgi:hypothetical protein